MLKVDQEALQDMESKYPGITQTILRYEAAELPACPRCGSADTAVVEVGVIGRTLQLAAATTKFKLMPRSPTPGSYYCNACGKFFD